MIRYRVLLLALLASLCAASSASAHRLKIFATTEGLDVHGYAFFIGSGRAAGVTLTVSRDGHEIHRATTDAEGSFRWLAPEPAEYRIDVDAGDGHAATVVLPASRFGGTAPQADAGPSAAAAPPMTADATAGVAAPTCTPTPESLAALVDMAAERAVARQIEPLLEAYSEADGRLRFNDVVGGVGMILGIAGIAAWARSRRFAGDGLRGAGS